MCVYWKGKSLDSFPNQTLKLASEEEKAGGNLDRGFSFPKWLQWDLHKLQTQRGKHESFMFRVWDDIRNSGETCLFCESPFGGKGADLLFPVAFLHHSPGPGPDIWHSPSLFIGSLWLTLP